MPEGNEALNSGASPSPQPLSTTPPIATAPFETLWQNAQQADARNEGTEANEGESSTASASANDEAKPGPIPYDRFKEVNERAKTYESELATLREQLQSLQAQPTEPTVDPDLAMFRELLGVSSAAELQQAIEENQKQQWEQSVFTHYQGLVDRGEMDEELAAREARLQIQQAELQQLQNRLAASERNTQIAEATRAYPSVSKAQSLFDKLVNAGMKPLEAAREVDALVASMTTAATSQVAAQVASTPPTPMGNSDAPPPSAFESSPQPASGRKPWEIPFERLFGINKPKDTI